MRFGKNVAIDETKLLDLNLCTFAQKEHHSRFSLWLATLMWSVFFLDTVTIP